jgi:hypothetical protein
MGRIEPSTRNAEGIFTSHQTTIPGGSLTVSPDCQKDRRGLFFHSNRIVVTKSMPNMTHNLCYRKCQACDNSRYAFHVYARTPVSPLAMSAILVRPRSNLGHPDASISLKTYIGTVPVGVNLVHGGLPHAKPHNHQTALEISQPDESQRRTSPGIPTPASHDQIPAKSTQALKRTEHHKGLLVIHSQTHQKAKVYPPSVSLRQHELLADQGSIRAVAS